MKGMIIIDKLLKNLLRLIFSMSLFLFVIISSVKITLNFRPLYYFDIKYLNLEKYTSLNNLQIKSTYDYLINYLNSSKSIDFNIPLLPSSQEGIIHFIEVKKLFLKFNFILGICTLITIFAIYFAIKYKDYLFLKWCSNIIFCTCFLLLSGFLWNFDKCFTFFHKLFFNNDYWLLDPKTDPIINILPETYFLHCALLILLLVISCSILLRLLYRKIRDDK